MMKHLSLVLTAFIASIALAQDAERRAQEEDSRRASEIQSAASAVRDRARDVRAAASNARAEASATRAKASELDSERARAQARRMTMASEISQLNAEASRLTSEAATLHREAAAFREQKVLVDAQIAKNNETLSALLKVVYNLEARVKFHEKESSDLQDVQDHIQSIQTNLDLLKSLQRRATDTMTASSKSHAEWMTELEKLASDLAPRFKDLKDFDGVAKASRSISAFEKRAPNPSRPNSLEDSAIGIEREISALSKNIQKQLRDLGSMPGIAVYHKYAKTEFDGSLWKGMDESIHQNVNLAEQFESLLNLFRERRVYLVRVIPLMWERMLNVRLDSIHLEKSVRTGQTALDGLSLPDTIAKSVELDSLHNQAARLLIELYSPLVASDRIKDALSLAETIDLRFKQLQISSATEQARIAFQSRKLRIKELGQDIQDAVQNKIEDNLKQRRRFIATESAGKSLSPTCETSKNEVLNTPANRANEKAYITFVEDCL